VTKQVSLLRLGETHREGCVSQSGKHAGSQLRGRMAPQKRAGVGLDKAAR
jgi:hypothetical protein